MGDKRLTVLFVDLLDVAAHLCVPGLVLETLIKLLDHRPSLVPTSGATPAALVALTGDVEASPISQVHLVGLGARGEEAPADWVFLSVIGP